MKKWKATTLLSIVSVVLAILLVMTFVRFPIGVKYFNSFLGAIETDYDLSGGNAFTLKLAKDNEEPVEDVNEVIATLENRLGQLGYESFSVKAIKTTDDKVEEYEIRIEAKADTNSYGLPDTTTLSEDIAAVAAYGEVEIYGGSESAPTTRILEDVQAIESAKYKGAMISGDSVIYQVEITFTEEAFETISQMMAENNLYLRVTIGETEILSGTEPLTSQYFSNRAIIMQSPTEASAKQLAMQISSGGLAYKYNIEGGQTVTSPYGKNVAFNSAIAITALVACIIVTALVFNKGFGFVYSLSLISFELLEILIFLAIPGIRLGLGGVIGIALATILVADGFIITSKRIKEEFANGKTFKASLKTGLSRAMLPIVNCGVVSIIVSLLLFAFTNGMVKNFAITFGIGAVLGIIATVVLVRFFSSIILPLVSNKEAFSNLKREEE